MSKDDLISGVVFGTILVAGFVLGFLGYRKINEPVWNDNSIKVEAENNNEDNAEEKESVFKRFFSKKKDKDNDAAEDISAAEYSSTENDFSMNSDGVAEYPAEAASQDEVQPEAETSADEGEMPADSTDSLNEATTFGKDLTAYLGKDVDAIDAELGPYADRDVYQNAVSIGILEYEDVSVQVWNSTGEVNSVTMLSNQSGHVIAGLSIGMSVSECEDTLAREYGAKLLNKDAMGADTYYYYIGDSACQITLNHSGDTVDSITASIDLFGVFIEPVDVSGSNSFTFVDETL